LPRDLHSLPTRHSSYLNEQITKTISLLATSNPTTINVITTVLVNDNISAQFRNSVLVINDISASSTHIIEDGQDFIQITIANQSDRKSTRLNSSHVKSS